MLHTLILIFFLFVNILYSAPPSQNPSFCLSASINAVSTCSTDISFEQGLSINVGSFDAGSSNITYNIPIYINTDSNDTILSTFDLTKLPNEYITNSNIGLTIQYFSNITNTFTSVAKQAIEILPSGYTSYRNGSNQIGYFKITFDAFEPIQTRGIYSDNISAQIKIGNKRYTQTDIALQLSINPILYVGLSDVSGHFEHGIFEYSEVNLGTLNPTSQTQVVSNVYVISNYANESITMTFNNTPPLVHNGGGDTIAMSYTYKNSLPISAGTAFEIASKGSNEGTSSVTNLTFTAEPASGKLDGAYRATILVTVSAQ